MLEKTFFEMKRYCSAYELRDIIWWNNQTLWDLKFLRPWMLILKTLNSIGDMNWWKTNFRFSSVEAVIYDGLVEYPFILSHIAKHSWAYIVNPHKKLDRHGSYRGATRMRWENNRDMQWICWFSYIFMCTCLYGGQRKKGCGNAIFSFICRVKMIFIIP